MPRQVKTRAYDGSRRKAAAAQTRQRILDAARELFLARGYDQTSVADIAEQAGTSIDTVYATVGRKAQLLLAVHDMELAAAPQPVPAQQRDYVQHVHAATTGAEMIRRYAAAMAERLPRTVPLMEALRAAGAKDPACAATYHSLSQRRLANMRLFAADLRSTGDLRNDLGDDEVARVIWSMNSPDYFRLLADAGCTPEEYAALVGDVWTRTLLTRVRA